MVVLAAHLEIASQTGVPYNRVIGIQIGFCHLCAGSDFAVLSILGKKILQGLTFCAGRIQDLTAHITERNLDFVKCI